MSADNRAAFRVWSLVFVVGGAIAALCVLQFMLSQIAAERGMRTPAPAVHAAR